MVKLALVTGAGQNADAASPRCSQVKWIEAALPDRHPG
jgi:hypothetical protein